MSQCGCSASIPTAAGLRAISDGCVRQLNVSQRSRDGTGLPGGEV